MFHLFGVLNTLGHKESPIIRNFQDILLRPFKENSIPAQLTKMR